ncbi:MAG: CDP-diacylglycerol--serine O-phosphatidyltransferase [Thermoanaerobaculia bacterium]|nr:CDP-diacylglycerol--serine O-phosphatidyltransferase [Thermoanaerobaculia bacterium]
MADGPRRLAAARGAYLLPSLFTIGNMFLGFYAIVLGLRDRFGAAALVIFCAGVLDGLDGRIARLMSTESEFGKEYDSLADLATFGIAPALLAYLWGLDEMGRIGWLIPLFFVVCTATRLARFNVRSHLPETPFFAGLPTPAAAGAVASVLFIAPDNDWKEWLNVLLLAVLVTLSLLMVSTFRYFSFKKIDLRRRRSYRVVLPIAAVLLVAAYHPPAFFVSAAALYTASGPALWLRGRLRSSESRADEAEERGS